VALRAQRVQRSYFKRCMLALISFKLLLIRAHLDMLRSFELTQTSCSLSKYPQRGAFWSPH
jgi:hypothetical protein